LAYTPPRRRSGQGPVGGYNRTGTYKPSGNRSGSARRSYPVSSYGRPPANRPGRNASFSFTGVLLVLTLAMFVCSIITAFSWKALVRYAVARTAVAVEQPSGGLPTEEIQLLTAKPTIEPAQVEDPLGENPDDGLVDNDDENSGDTDPE